MRILRADRFRNGYDIGTKSRRRRTQAYSFAKTPLKAAQAPLAMARTIHRFRLVQDEAPGASSRLTIVLSSSSFLFSCCCWPVGLRFLSVSDGERGAEDVAGAAEGENVDGGIVRAAVDSAALGRDMAGYVTHARRRFTFLGALVSPGPGRATGCLGFGGCGMGDQEMLARATCVVLSGLGGDQWGLGG